MGRDPRLPTTLDMDTKIIQEIYVDIYEGEMAITFNEAWDLAQNNIRSAQRHQNVYYDKQSSPLRFNIGESVGVHACS